MPAKSSEKSSCEIKSSEKTASFEKLSTAPFDTRFPNQNQTRLVVFFSNVIFFVILHLVCLILGSYIVDLRE